MQEPLRKAVDRSTQAFTMKAGERITLRMEGSRVEIQALQDGGAEVTLSGRRVGFWRQQWRALALWLKLRWRLGFLPNLPWLLAGLAMLIYLLTRLIDLKNYPIYFFTDEAVQTLLAEDLVKRFFFDNDGHFLPTFFFNGYQYNLGISVYLQVIPYLLFGRVMQVTRGVSVLASSLSAVFLYLISLRIYRSKYPWLVILLLSTTPVWFLHSRTAFETALAFTFYSGFVYFYLAYRQGETANLYGAVIMAALAFYTYSPLRAVVLGNALAFFLMDLRYHMQHKRQVGLAAVWAVLCALPFLRFELQYPGQNLSHLRVLGSYWLSELSLPQKLLRYLWEYACSFSPDYWFLPQTTELPRHRMGLYPYILTWLLPFVLGGMWIAVRRWREAPYRILMIVFLLAPIGTAMVERGITRVLILVIPFLLFAMLGLDWLLTWIQGRRRVSMAAISLILFIPLAGFNGYLLYDALVNGPTWSTDYGLGGMQYGAVQLAEKIPQLIAEQDEPVDLMLTPTWANGTDIVMRFFFGTPLPFRLGSVNTYIDTFTPLTDDTVMVLTQEEMQRLLENEKFTDVQIVDRLLYPDSTTGFYFVKCRYVDNIQEIFEAEASARRLLQTESLAVGGVPAVVSYSYLDMGEVSQIFDHDVGTLIRTMEANPLVIQIYYDFPVNLQTCTAMIGGTPSDIDLQLFNTDGIMLAEYQAQYLATPDPHTVDIGIAPQQDVAQMRFTLKNSEDAEPSHVHLWELTCTRQAEE